MADAEVKTDLPATIRLVQSMTPNEMRALKEHTGRPLSDLLGGDPEDMNLAPDRLQAMTWVALRRAGYDASWDEAGDVVPDTSEATPDPTKRGTSSSYSTFADGGE